VPKRNINYRYDIGTEDSQYFVNLNDCLQEKVSYEYCDCKGEKFYVTVYEDLPYKQGKEILPPVFISTTWGSETFFRNKVKKVPYIVNNKVYINLQYPFNVGDIFKLDKSNKPNYYIKSRSKKYMDSYGNFIYQISRLDNSEFVEEDFKMFKLNQTILLYGFLSDVKNCR